MDQRNMRGGLILRLVPYAVNLGDDLPGDSGAIIALSLEESILPAVFIPSRFVYLVAGLSGLYLSVAPFLTSDHGPITWFRVGLWIATILLLISAVLPSSRTTNVGALVGSTLATVLLVYGIVRFVAFRLGYVHGKVQIGAYQPNAFDLVNRIVSKPMLLLFLISSLASLLISALITLRSRNRTTFADNTSR